MPTIRLDASLAIAPKVETGVPVASFEAERAAGTAAVKAVHGKVTSGELGFWDLPDGKDLANTCSELAKELSTTFKRLVVFGIGGSSLGGRMMQSALAKKDASEVVFVDNVDPHSLHALFAEMDWENTAFNVISKSGGTVETAAQFVLLREKLKAALGDDGYRARVVATTDPEKGLLHDIAAEDGLRTLPIPHNVGGRFSVLTAVGLFPAAYMGIDIQEMLQGAGSMRSRCVPENANENPALMNAMLHTLAEKKGQPIHVMMPYSDRLRPFAEWYGQLWAESLGKCTNQAGQPQVTGPTPVVALGATDQHSQIQLFTEGPADKFFTFLAVDDAEQDVSFPTNLPDGYAYLTGHSIAGLLDAERRGTTLALARLGRPSVTLHLPKVNAHAIGELIFLYEAQTAFAGELLDVNAFDQPGVEMGKRIAFALMGRDEFSKDLEGLGELSKVGDAWCA
ncbi:MAG: glucose-6-phosphate isomerase [Deltaproteobacteria bacterium]|nr:glucose-6-phosphate isomerase [Deltaproteobacteria bacterium]